ncbi:hypothetical protein IWQ60_002753 [Tieghemiomyces parasiticus]|uniref:RlpA-like protein double-psi beta-barrel domain-containing protein n=1 Tax=Tieghemiomyces parasiticus TaxID=78921 RepID=A0A9W8E1C6_9FUNG|nr:hypothetical protein IWQ60_002753 [Tieghemiomyces parasiticus]
MYVSKPIVALSIALAGSLLVGALPDHRTFPRDTHRQLRRGEEFTGDGTYYSPSVGTGACGWDNSDSEKVVALNAPQFGEGNPNSNSNCGKMVNIKGPKGEVQAKIVDKCPVCKSGDLDMSPGAFDEIADEADGRVSITWSFAS